MRQELNLPELSDLIKAKYLMTQDIVPTARASVSLILSPGYNISSFKSFKAMRLSSYDLTTIRALYESVRSERRHICNK